MAWSKPDADDKDKPKVKAKGKGTKKGEARKTARKAFQKKKTD